MQTSGPDNEQGTMEQESAGAGRVKAPEKRRRLLRRMVLWLLAAAVILVVLLAAAGWYALTTESGTRQLWSCAVRLSQGHFSGDLAGGRFSRGIDAQNIHVSTATLQLDIDNLSGRWIIRPWQRSVVIERLHAGTIATSIKPTTSKSSPFPESLRLPFKADLRSLTVDKLVLHQPDGKPDQLFSALDATASTDGVKHALAVHQLITPFGKVFTDLHLNGTKPFAIQGNVGAAGTFEKHAFSMSTVLSGSLQTLDADVRVSSDQLDGTALITATPFNPVPFEKAKINLRHIDPRWFSASAPGADFDLVADIRPQAVPSAEKTPLRVSGALSLVNNRPLPFDQQGIPVTQMRMDVDMDARHQSLSNIVIGLLNRGKLTGQADYHAGDHAGKNAGGELILQGSDLDASLVSRQLQPTRLNGPLRITLEPGQQTVQAKLADDHIRIEADAVLNTLQITLSRLFLQAGSGTVEAKGTIGMNDRHPVVLTGAVRHLNPQSLLAATVRTGTGSGTKKGSAPRVIPQADINLDLALDAVLPAAPGIMQARLVVSGLGGSYAGLPLSGDADIRLAGRTLAPSSLDLVVAGNEIHAKGAFGRPADSMTLAVSAPALDRLGFGVAGQLQLNGVVSGSTLRPAFHGTAQADRIVFNTYKAHAIHLAADAALDLNAPLTSNRNRLNIDLGASGVEAAGLVLEQLAIKASGTAGEHTIQLNGKGQFQNQPLAVRFDVHGGVQQKAGNRGIRYGWDGVINQLSSTTAPEVALAAPWRVHVFPDDIALGAARLDLFGNTLNLKHLTLHDGELASAGQLEKFNVQSLLTVLKRYGIRLPSMTNTLILDADWDFSIGATATGFAQVRRTAGDLGLDTGRGQTVLGLSGASVRTDFQGITARLLASADAASIGNLTLSGTVGLQPGAMLKLMPSSESTLSATLHASVPDLQKVAALVGPQIALTGALNADMQLAGTLGKPSVSGLVSGDQLAVESFDEGIELHGGQLRARFADNVLHLDQFSFHGSAGTLTANGEIRFGAADPSLAVTVLADKLELFASPDRQLMLSGRATATNADQKLRINGDFTVDRALFDLPKSSAPKLGDDVRIVRTAEGKTTADYRTAQQRRQTREAVPASQFSPYIDLGLDFGSSFRFRGSGADLLLGGKMHVVSEPSSPLRATGTVHVVNGTYEVFGKKLSIENGIINFQGPINNPNINILAMRRNQEVAAGAQITGTVALPRVTLVSEPSVSDQEKLSWLMFGHGSDSTSLSQREAAGQALAAIGNLGGKKIAQSIGVDEFSIGSSEAGLTDAQVLNIGKSLTEKISLGFEQGLTTAASVLKLTWQFSQRWSAVLKGGTINGVAVQYNRRFN